MRCTIGAATVADIPALVELLRILFSQEAEFSPDPEAQARGLKLLLADAASGHILVARADARVIGMVSLLYTVSTALGARVAWLEDMVLDPAWRNRGVGSRLLVHAIEFARAHGCERITLLTDADNAAAQGFYQRHGFRPSPMRPWRLRLHDGRPL